MPHEEVSRSFLDYAKKNPDMITVGNSGAGGRRSPDCPRV